MSNQKNFEIFGNPLTRFELSYTFSQLIMIDRSAHICSKRSNVNHKSNRVMARKHYNAMSML